MVISTLVAGVVLDSSQVRRKVRKTHNHPVSSTDDYCPRCGVSLWQFVENELDIEGIVPFPVNKNQTAFIVGEIVLQVLGNSAGYALVNTDFSEPLTRVQKSLGSLCNDTLGVYLVQLPTSDCEFEDDTDDNDEFKWEEF